MPDRFQQAIRYIKCNNRKNLRWLLRRYPYLKNDERPQDHDGLLAEAILYNPNLIPWLVEQGINPETRMSDGGTPLMMAASNDRIELSRLLISHGASVNAKNDRGETPFSFCCANNCLAIAKLLFAHGADVNTVDDGGGSPLDWALCWSSEEFCQWLILVGGKRHDLCQTTANPIIKT